MNLSVNAWLDTKSYQRQKEIIGNETNRLKRVNNYALIRIPAPGEIHRAFQLIFKQSKAEKALAKAVKKEHRRELRKHYGANYKKFLNIPSRQIEKPIKIVF